MIMDPALAAIIGACVGSIFTLLGSVSVAWLRERAENRRHLREIGSEMAKAMYDRQFWLAENSPPGTTHQLKAIDYWLPYYMMFAERLPKNCRSSDALKEFLASMSEVEPILRNWVESNEASRQKNQRREQDVGGDAD